MKSRVLFRSFPGRHLTRETVCASFAKPNLKSNSKATIAVREDPRTQGPMNSPFAFFFVASVFALSLASGASAQSTGMGVTLKDPMPRDPDLRVVLQSDPAPTTSTADLKRLQAERTRRQAQVLSECNQILVLSHELHLKLLTPAAATDLPSNIAMTSKIADLARKVQKDMQAQ